MAVQIEEAVIRILERAVILPPPAPQPKLTVVATKVRTKKTRTVDEINGEYDHLLKMHGEKRVSDENFDRNSKRLDGERAAVAALTVQESAADLSAEPRPGLVVMTDGEGGQASNAVRRQSILAYTARIDAMVEMPDGVTILIDDTFPDDADATGTRVSHRRYIRVTVNFGTLYGSVFYSGLYKTTWRRSRPVWYVPA
jgi:hypothetical protein